MTRHPIRTGLDGKRYEQLPRRIDLAYGTLRLARPIVGPGCKALGSTVSIRTRMCATCPSDCLRIRQAGLTRDSPIVGSRQPLQLEQPGCICTGGHLSEPYEQNTQQSPVFGRNTALQRSHS